MALLGLSVELLFYGSLWYFLDFLGLVFYFKLSHGGLSLGSFCLLWHVSGFLVTMGGIVVHW